MEQLKYFLAANSAEGFFSAFPNSYSAHDGWRAFLIKGGPGTGKSSFMKYFTAKAMDKGYETLLCPCSSDPDSLDAVILPQKKIIIMDATSPHTVEPLYPAACETVLDFSRFWNGEMLFQKSKEIIEITDQNKQLHKTASRYIKAAGQLLMDNYKTALACTDQDKTISYADRLCKHFIPKCNGNGKEWIRFIEGITPKGIVAYPKTVLNCTKNTIIIKDEYAGASNIIIEYIRNYSLNNGYEIITIKNPFLPSLITDHIIIPSLSLSVVTENQYMQFKTDTRRVHARRFTKNKQLHLSRERMKFNKRAMKELFVSAIDTLSQAKNAHDVLEKYYISAMDFASLTDFAKKFTEEIL